MKNILFIDDDKSILNSLTIGLRISGFSVRAVTSAEEGLKSYSKFKPDLIIVDLGLPGISGLEFIRLLRKKGDLTPIILLTAKTESRSKVLGLNAGADDYISKPFDLPELIARVNAALRRSPQRGTATLAYGDFYVDMNKRLITYKGINLDLTNIEYSLLLFLIKNNGRVLPFDEIYQTVWGYAPEGRSKNLNVYVTYLRKKLNQVGAEGEVVSVRGVGYSIREIDD